MQKEESSSIKQYKDFCIRIIMIHFYSLLVNNYAQSVCSIFRIFLGIGILKVSYDTLKYIFPPKKVF